MLCAPTIVSTSIKYEMYMYYLFLVIMWKIENYFSLIEDTVRGILTSSPYVR